MSRLKIFIVLAFCLGITKLYGQSAAINARITPVISTNNDSLYLDVEVSRSIVNDALGNSDFSFRITDARTSVPGLTSPIDLTNGFSIKARGLWDESRDTNFTPVTLSRSVDGGSYILKVRTKTPRSFTQGSNSRIPTVFGPTSLVARLAIKIESGACVDSIRLEWNRNRSNSFPLGYLTTYSFQNRNDNYGNNFIPVSPNNYIKLRPLVSAPEVGIASLPQAVMFTWYSVPNVRQYFARIVKNNKAETTFVSIGNGSITEYRAQARPRDTVFFTLFAKSSCSFDSVTSSTAFGVALECPIITIEPSQLRLSKSTPYCPTELVTITVDTTDKNLTKPVRFSFNGQITTSNSISFRGTRDSTFRITYEDGDFCDANTTLTLNVPILRLTQPNTAITMNLPDSLCLGSDINLAFNPVGDNLIYSWTTTGAGSFIDAGGQIVTNPIGSPIRYRPAANETGVVRFRAFNECFNIGTSDSIKLLPLPVAAVDFDRSQLSGTSLPANVPIRFSRTNPVTGERYRFIFSDNVGNVLDTTGSTITRTFALGGSFRLVLTVTNSSGCTDTANVAFNVVENFNLFVPNIFSPAATNGKDDAFRLNGVGVQEAIELIVFDKWGTEVYKAENFTKAKNEGWNGKKDNTGDLQQSGTYSYVVRGKFQNNSNFEKTGTVTLIR